MAGIGQANLRDKMTTAFYFLLGTAHSQVVVNNAESAFNKVKNEAKEAKVTVQEFIDTDPVFIQGVINSVVSGFKKMHKAVLADLPGISFEYEAMYMAGGTPDYKYLVLGALAKAIVMRGEMNQGVCIKIIDAIGWAPGTEICNYELILSGMNDSLLTFNENKALDKYETAAALVD